MSDLSPLIFSKVGSRNSTQAIKRKRISDNIFIISDVDETYNQKVIPNYRAMRLAITNVLNI